MKIYVVVDTNVVVSGIITKNPFSPTRRILKYVEEGVMVPLINHDILFEYQDVLSRNKFHLTNSDVDNIMSLFRLKGEHAEPICSDIWMVDQDDLIFYQTYLSNDESYLVTGNQKHFPIERKIISPSDMIHIISQLYADTDVLSDPHIPYQSESSAVILERARATIENIRARSAENGVGDMTMEEIDEEIRQYRKSKVR